jgi:hypothetical protein
VTEVGTTMAGTFWTMASARIPTFIIVIMIARVVVRESGWGAEASLVDVTSKIKECFDAQIGSLDKSIELLFSANTNVNQWCIKSHRRLYIETFVLGLSL